MEATDLVERINRHIREHGGLEEGYDYALTLWNNKNVVSHRGPVTNVGMTPEHIRTTVETSKFFGERINVVSMSRMVSGAPGKSSIWFRFHILGV